MTANVFTLTLADLGATEAWAARCAALAEPGDVFLLSGEIGAGKTTFARSFIQALLGSDEEVPSPTYTIVQTYDAEQTIWHADLYRLGGPDEVVELGLDAAFEDAICLVEWPDRLGDLIPANPIHIEMRAGPDGHTAQVTASERWAVTADA